jgi:DNA-binding transcriptional MerR regulator
VSLETCVVLISEFARLGQVSVRMLRHYDALGLLSPDRVERGTGYRVYSPDQLHVLNRIIAFRDLGFDLRQIAALVAADLDIGELRGMLRLRQADLEGQARAVDMRLAAVGARLQMIERENTMPKDYVLKTVPATRLAALTATVDPRTLGDHIEPMFIRVAAALEHESGALETPIATYAETEDGMSIAVGYAYSGPVPDDLELVDLPASQAVCGVHLGPVTTIQASWQDLHRWVIDNGFSFAGPCREYYVRAQSDDQSDWVTELQQPVTERADSTA